MILGAEANEQQALSYGCIVEEPSTHKVWYVCVYFVSPVWEKGSGFLAMVGGSVL